MVFSSTPSPITAAELRTELTTTILEPLMAEIGILKEQINEKRAIRTSKSLVQSIDQPVGDDLKATSLTKRAAHGLEKGLKKVRDAALDIPSKRGWRVVMKDKTASRTGVGLLFRSMTKAVCFSGETADELPLVETDGDKDRIYGRLPQDDLGSSLVAPARNAFDASAISRADKRKKTSNHLAQLQRIFQQLDGIEQSDESPPGYMTKTDLDSALLDAAIMKDFRTIGIDPKECSIVFEELDPQHVGLVSVNEFVSRCYSLRSRELLHSSSTTSIARLQNMLDSHESQEGESSRTSFYPGLRRSKSVLDGFYYGTLGTRIVRNIWFNYLCGCAVLMSSISLGMETDYRAKEATEDIPAAFKNLNLILCIFFLAEHCIRLAALGLSRYLKKHKGADAFDFICVCMLSLEICLRWSAVLRSWLIEDLSIFALTRAMRLVRVVHLFELLKVSLDFRKLWFCIIHSVKSLFWTCCLILGVVYITSVYLTQVVTHHMLQHRESNHEEERLHKYFGTLDRTLLSLYEAMADGIEWVELVEPLREEISIWAALIFSLCMAFVMFAMLNVITAHLCEHAVKLGKQDETVKLKEEMKEILRRIGAAEDGTITWDEFHSQLKSKQMREFLEIVELNRDDAILLFNILDTSGDKRVEANAFVDGCMRVNGPAKATDIVQMTKQWNSIVENIEDTLHSCIQDHSLYIAQLIEELRVTQASGERNS